MMPANVGKIGHVLAATSQLELIPRPDPAPAPAPGYQNITDSALPVTSAHIEYSRTIGMRADHGGTAPPWSPKWTGHVTAFLYGVDGTTVDTPGVAGRAMGDLAIRIDSPRPLPWDVLHSVFSVIPLPSRRTTARTGAATQ